MRAILCIGCSGSGKTTEANRLARDEGYININRDSLRFSLFGVDGWDEYRFDHKNERLITCIQNDMIHECFIANRDFIVSDTHLNENTRGKTIQSIIDHGIMEEDIEIMEFNVPLEELLRRDKNRGKYSVGANVIVKQYDQWLDYIRG